MKFIVAIKCKLCIQLLAKKAYRISLLVQSIDPFQSIVAVANSIVTIITVIVIVSRVTFATTCVTKAVLKPPSSGTGVFTIINLCLHFFTFYIVKIMITITPVLMCFSYSIAYLEFPQSLGGPCLQ